MTPLSETCPMDAPNARNPMCASVAAVDAPRRQPSTTLHALAAILLSTILGTMCGAHNWVEIAPWGQAQEAWRAECLALPHGLPSHDTFGRVCALRDPESLPQACVAWLSALAQLCQALMALDGKTMRRSLDRADGKGPRQVGRAWASRHELVLAPGTGEAKSNEIPARPARLALRNLEGRLVTSAALGCQGEIAQQLRHQGGDSVRS
jgi:DDE_Tnp_1-associated